MRVLNLHVHLGDRRTASIVSTTDGLIGNTVMVLDTSLAYVWQPF
jgi:hypothetical protein